MKTSILNQKKWILPSLLVATLAANNYYQSTSLTMGSADLASKEASDTQGKAAITDCKECTQEQINAKVLSQLQSLTEALNDLKKPKEQAQVAPKKQADKDETENTEKETPAEKRERIANEKKEKIKDEFNAKVEKLADKCDSKDLDCATSGLTSLLGRYTGTKKLDSATVSAAYSKLLSKPIREALKSSDTESLSALADLVNEIPKEYQSLKTKTLDIVKTDTQIKAQAVNSEYRMAQQAFQQKNPQSQQQHLFNAQTSFQKLQQNTNGFVQTISNNAASEQDNQTLSYIRENFDMNKLFANITSVGNFSSNQSGQQNGGEPGTGQQNGGEPRTGQQNGGQPGTVQQTGSTSTRQAGGRVGIPMQGGNNQMMGNPQPMYNQMNMNQNMFPQNQNMMTPPQPMYNQMNSPMNGGYNPMMNNGMNQQSGGVTFRGIKQ